ncbi:MAG: NUDIX domain-containing protein [Nitrososphaerales archaeon]
MSSPKTARLVPQPDGTQPEEVMHISSFVFVKKGSQLLLARRVKPERWAGKWCIPGAIINYGEDPGAAALRIVREQVGTAATSLRLLDVQSYGDKHWDMCFLFHADIPEVGKLGGDFDKAEYFDLANLPAELREDHREVLAMAKSRKVV